MPLHTRVSGAWREVTPGDRLQVNVSGTWRACSDGWVKVSGVWHRFYQNVIIDLIGTSSGASATAPTDATTRFRLDSDGNQYQGAVPSSVGAYISPTSETANYSVRATVTSGALSTGTTGSWLALSTSPEWTVTFTGNNGSASATVLFEFARSSDTGTVVYSESHTMTATVSP